MIPGLARAWLIAMIASTTIALISAIMARLWRRHDAAFWHSVWTAIVAVALVAPIATLVLPTVLVIWSPTPALPAVQVPVLPDRLFESLAAAYALGVLVMAARLTAGVVLIRELRRQCAPLGPPWLAGLKFVNSTDAKKCRVHPRITSPVTIGCRDPIVVLPQVAASWPSLRLRAVLRHEFAHIERRDYLWNLCAAVYLVIYWPNPIAWWLVRRARLAAEFACDRAASNEIGDAEYAQLLVQNAREFIAGGQSFGVVAPGADTDLFVRVDALLTASAVPRPPSRWAARIAVAAIATLILGACLVRIGSSAHARDEHWRFHAIHHIGH